MQSNLALLSVPWTGLGGLILHNLKIASVSLPKRKGIHCRDEFCSSPRMEKTDEAISIF